MCDNRTLSYLAEERKRKKVEMMGVGRGGGWRRNIEANAFVASFLASLEFVPNQCKGGGAPGRPGVAATSRRSQSAVKEAGRKQVEKQQQRGKM